MSRYVNISELAGEVLSSVAGERTKTASASATAPTSQYVPVAQELMKLADDLRAAPESDEVSDEDLAMLMQDPEVMQLLQELEANPELMQMLMSEEGMDDGMGGDPAAMGGDPAMEIPGGAGGDVPPGGDPLGGNGGNPFGGGGEGPSEKGDKEKDNSSKASEDPPKKKEKPDDCDDEESDGGRPPPFGGKMAALSSDLRKLAQNLRAQDVRSKQKRLVKAAAMVNAATGLQHLIGGSK